MKKGMRRILLFELLEQNEWFIKVYIAPEAIWVVVSHDNYIRQSSRDQMPGELGILEVRPGYSSPVLFFSNA